MHKLSALQFWFLCCFSLYFYSSYLGLKGDCGLVLFNLGLKGDGGVSPVYVVGLKGDCASLVMWWAWKAITQVLFMWWAWKAITQVLFMWWAWKVIMQHMY